MAAFPAPAKPSGRAATKRARSLNDQFQARSQETSTMTTIRTRPYPDGGAAVTGRAAPRTASRSLAPPGRAGPVLPRFTRRHLSIYPVWSTTMPTNTRSPQSRPHGAPACYLARPASLRVTALGRQPQQRLTHRTGKSRS